MNKKHLLLIDILKIMTLMAIAILHANEFVFYEDEFPLGASSPIWHAWSYYARVFTLGGQILVAIIYFLFGLSGKSKQALLKISGFALIGQLVLALVFQEFEWDIYAYIAVANLLIAAMPFLYKKKAATIIVSFIFLCIPTSIFQNALPDSPFWVILTGKMSLYNSGSWPILPWFALATLFYQTGLFVRSNWENMSKLTFSEKIFWPLGLLATIPLFGIYYWVPIGPNFYNYVFNQAPYYFWANFLIFVFVMRLSLLDSVQSKLDQSKIVHWISRLFWIRHMGLVYLLSILYLGLGMVFSDHYLNNPLLFDLFFIGVMPVPELVGRFLVYMLKYRS